MGNTSSCVFIPIKSTIRSSLRTLSNILVQETREISESFKRDCVCRLIVGDVEVSVCAGGSETSESDSDSATTTERIYQIVSRPQSGDSCRIGQNNQLVTESAQWRG